MNIGQKRIFSDPEILKEMFDLRRKGFSLPTLALKYNCHHTSILNQCKKAGVEPDNPTFVIKVNRPRKSKIPVYDSKLHCSVCDLLLTSTFFCDFCKNLKTHGNKNI